MSAKQARKLKNMREMELANSGEIPDIPPPSSQADVADSNADGPGRKAVFALLGDSESDKEDSDSESDQAPVIVAPKVQPSRARNRSKKKPSTHASSVASCKSKAAPSEDAADSDDVEEDDDDIALREAAALRSSGGDADDVNEIGEACDGDAVAFEAGVLSMRRKDFSLENERRRAVGAGIDASHGPQRRRTGAQGRRGGEGLTAHHRRLFLVSLTAEEPWLRPADSPSMVSRYDEDKGAVFDIEETPESARALERVRECLRRHDLGALQNLLQHSPFCIDALLTFAEYHRTHQSPEQAFKCVRAAVYALECSFNSAWTPFQETGVGSCALRPRVALELSEDLTWPGWSWLRTLWLYMQMLAGQGMFRTSLEVCKLLLAVTLPDDPTHVFLWLDYLCLRSQQYDFLHKFVFYVVSQYGLGCASGRHLQRLGLIFPNFAYSAPLAGFLKAAAPPPLSLINEVSISDILPNERDYVASAGSAEGDTDEVIVLEGAALHAHLMRALLFFPLGLRPILEEAGVNIYGAAPGGSPSRASWAELLSKPPFSNAMEHRHEQHAAAHGRICGAYSKRCGSLWRGDLTIRWLHACAARLTVIHESSVFAADLAAARDTWAATASGLDDCLKAEYVELSPAEGSVEVSPLPPKLEQACQERLHRRRDDEMLDGVERDLPPNVSLHSPPLLIFLHTLLPWSELDRSGLHVEPMFWFDVARSAALASRDGVVSFARFSISLVHLVGELVGIAVSCLRDRCQRLLYRNR